MVFLIGGRGLVGSALARQCEAQGLPFAILDRESYPRYRGQSCSLLINANGNSPKPLAVSDPLADFDASVRSVRASLADFRCQALATKAGLPGTYKAWLSTDTESPSTHFNTTFTGLYRLPPKDLPILPVG